MADHFPSLSLTRRDALTGALALAAVPWRSARSAAETSLLVRRSVTGADLAPAALDSFKRAIRAMLALPPSDPRNWYRQALIHVLDCPHGNWWFLPWHRGYLFHFEEICRQLSGDPEFALPYWDWTSAPRVPDVLFDDVLTPTHELYEESFATFRPKFVPAIGDLWNGLTAAQREQLALRGYATAGDIWEKLEGYFSAREAARGPTREAPELPDWAKTEVGPERVTAALAPKRFEDFGSTPSDNHHMRAIQDTLESGPHNNIHNAVGGGPGFMSELLAPVDPIFWLHHANVDRLWDLWTRRSAKPGAPRCPTRCPAGTESRSCSSPAATHCRSAISRQAHSATAIRRASARRSWRRPSRRHLSRRRRARRRSKARRCTRHCAPTRRRVRPCACPTPCSWRHASRKRKRGGAHASSGAPASHDEPELVARVSLSPPQNPRAVRVLFFLNCSYLSPETPLADPHYVGSVTFFGLHGGHHHAAHVTATLPLNGTLQRLAEAGDPVMSQVKLQGIATRDNGEHQTLDGALVQVSVKSV